MHSLFNSRLFKRKYKQNDAADDLTKQIVSHMKMFSSFKREQVVSDVWLYFPRKIPTRKSKFATDTKIKVCWNKEVGAAGRSWPAKRQLCDSSAFSHTHSPVCMCVYVFVFYLRSHASTPPNGQLNGFAKFSDSLTQMRLDVEWFFKHTVATSNRNFFVDSDQYYFKRNIL